MKFSVRLESSDPKSLLQLVCEANRLGVRATISEVRGPSSPPVSRASEILPSTSPSKVIRSRQNTFEYLLRYLCDNIEQPIQTNGRPKLPLSDVIYASVLKVYTNKSLRGAYSDISESKLIHVAPHYNSLSNYFRLSELASILDSLITLTASPLMPMESKFEHSVSSFSTTTYLPKPKEYGAKPPQRWIICSALVGVTTNLISSIETSSAYVGSPTEIPELLPKVRAPRAHKAEIPSSVLSMWNRLCSELSTNSSRLSLKPSKVSAFTIIKTKFGGAVKSKDEVAQVNEILCKVLAHNLGVLAVQARYAGVYPGLLTNC
jgi:hypothetical protein